jgi:hypothetical protein
MILDEIPISEALSRIKIGSQYPHRPTPIQFPSRKQTIMGMKAFKANPIQAEQAVNDETVLLRYPVSVHKGPCLYTGVVVTYLELADWCEMKGYALYSVDGPIDMAKPGERTKLQ